jgi:hypothetical protein
MPKPTVIKLAPWVIGAMCLAAVSLLGMSWYFFFYGTSYVMRYAGMAIAAFAIAAAADAIASKIILDGDTMHIVSLMRRRSFPRSEFVSAQVNRGAVVLKRKEGGWVILPGTGRAPLAVRDTLQTWLAS